MERIKGQEHLLQEKRLRELELFSLVRGDPPLVDPPLQQGGKLSKCVNT